jgi:rhomboid protease GluP
MSDTPEAPPPPAVSLPQTFALRTQRPPISGGFVVALYGLVFFFAAASPALIVATRANVSGAVVALVLVACLVTSWGLLFLLLRRFNRVMAPAPIVVGPTTIAMPRTLRDDKPVEMPLADVHSVEARGRKGNPLVVIGTRAGFFLFPKGAFVDDDAGPRLRTAIRAGIAALPHGPELVAEMDAREHGGVVTTRRKTPATGALLGFCAALFVVELAAGGTADPQNLIRLGANAPALVAEGQWWRLFCAGFLHLSLVHILLNGSALFSLGALLEKILGSWRFLVVALASSVAGNLASMVTRSHVYSAGASSFIFGLIGSLLVVNLRHGKQLPAGFFLGARRWTTLLVVNAAVSMLPGVDGLAHLGGLVAGGVLTFVLVPELDIDPPKKHPLARAVAIALLLVFSAAFGVMAARATGLIAADHASDLDKARASVAR